MSRCVNVYLSPSLPHFHFLPYVRNNLSLELQILMVPISDHAHCPLQIHMHDGDLSQVSLTYRLSLVQSVTQE